MNRREFMKTMGWATAGLAMASARQGRVCPNMVLILADDMGFSDSECYGGEIATPNLAALAAGGLRFTQHYSTGRCWPSRACLLTGYYAQHIRRDAMPGVALGNRPSWAPLLPSFLKTQGYKSYHSGKWHIDGETLQSGFDRSWGGHRKGCDWDRFFASEIWEEGGVRAPVKEGENYYSTVAVADHAIQCLKLHQSQNNDQPFFQYIAFFSPHFPLHALQEDIEKYRDFYMEGWDIVRQRRWERMTKMGIVNCTLSEREEEVVPSWNLSPEQLREKIGPGEQGYAVAWETLTEEQRRFQASKMAIHAAMISRMDHEIGRVVQQLKDMGVFENTLILFASDNGASAEQIIRGDGHDPGASMGSAASYLCLGPGWSTAANTPFRFHKHWNHEGGISSPLIVHWPEGIEARGELRHDASHFIDIAPTVMELAGASWPDRIDGAKVPPKPGLSLVPAFARDGAVCHESLWWCHTGHRAIRMGDWKLVARQDGPSPWELYDLKTDRSESRNVAEKHPDVVEHLSQTWESMAERFREDLKGM